MSCLIIVDVQNDFMEGGSLEVKNASEILKPINRLRDRHNFDMVVLSKDFHPLKHVSFASTHANKKPFDTVKTKSNSPQLLFPDHCVQNTYGSEFNKKLKVLESDTIITKGMNVDVDSYSAFFDNDKLSKTPLDNILKKNSIKNVYVCGLATDFCVSYTCLDAKSLGFNTFFLKDASRGISTESVEAAIKKMKESNINIIETEDLIRSTSKNL
ncbi:hypothetical protein DICPUDRAFT_155005 [Dictyostelium purpureum]|uniref:nicotinamidase n=1 Tax=Dictyostelium purpureum TaxID=5786 RepID=F0ZST9_DICPU|nr:uncharacterized protein DICPUDRAFT_155005 [Dictyostelium purpureum]EGC33013.1 hypothetical protein DICPUDRAFT_155005 [Dictyostelium purpureum]|eukprot:XP_003290483.1 hypothetical protein DICPUDRAFT_155005 [Dictyostelium purpureum]